MSYLKWYFFAVLLLNWPAEYVDGSFYCTPEVQAELCQSNEHIVCNQDSIEQRGTFNGHFPMTSKMKHLLVEGHNRYRDRLANGREKFKNGSFFPVATRMLEVTWDDELAYISSVQSARCNLQHDTCRNTRKYKFAGQNLALIGANTQLSAKKAIEEAMKSWWDSERVLVANGHAMVGNLSFDLTKNCGHFTTMAQEQLSRIGCSVASCDDVIIQGRDVVHYAIFTTCNYDYTNMIGAPVYKTGNKSACNCEDWGGVPSLEHPHLCKRSGFQ